ncbi:MAG TPA: hypothetical protein VE242_07225 [Chthoniobacterales bacterium]|nr:hypothetical protein [Chthoniobacterales bacterium]
MIKHHRGYGENLGDYRLLIAIEESPAIAPAAAHARQSREG